MKITKLSALAAAPLLFGLATAASAGPAVGVNLGILGPALGNSALPGTGLKTISLGSLGGLALALKNYDGAGHSQVGLTLGLGYQPLGVHALPGLPAGPVQLGVQAPSLGDAIPQLATNKYTLSGLGSAILTLTNNDGRDHTNVGLAVIPDLLP